MSEDKPTENRNRKRPWGGIILVLFILVSIVGAVFYLRYQQRYPSTDDAYLNTHIVHIAPRINGQVVSVPIQENEMVEKGQLLFEIDSQPFKLALEKARADYQLAQQQMAGGDAGNVAAAAELRARRAELEKAMKNNMRIQKLVRERVLPESKADDATEALRSARAAVDQAEADLQKSLKDEGGSGAAGTRLALARIEVEQAKLNLSYTRVLAPSGGRINRLTLRPGAWVNAGTPQFVLVDNRHWWIDANFKETHMGRIRPGQTARVQVDMLSGKTFSGKVESISASSGASFSLLPSENASGNWVKVTQRFPVRILLPEADAALFRVGASGSVTVDTVADKPTP